mmetsp:Transcript_106125/g.297054  ORF Transcript_106125/g.297054 Transcript_106125/m.297054 type:complete len:275 (+) Transcript_106125:370-1194(+)
MWPPTSEQRVAPRFGSKSVDVGAPVSPTFAVGGRTFSKSSSAFCNTATSAFPSATASALCTAAASASRWTCASCANFRSSSAENLRSFSSSSALRRASKYASASALRLASSAFFDASASTLLPPAPSASGSFAPASLASRLAASSASARRAASASCDLMRLSSAACLSATPRGAAQVPFAPSPRHKPAAGGDKGSGCRLGGLTSCEGGGPHSSSRTRQRDVVANSMDPVAQERERCCASALALSDSSCLARAFAALCRSSSALFARSADNLWSS